MAGRNRQVKRIGSHVRCDDLRRPCRFSRALQRQAKSPIREIGVQRDGLLVRGYGLFMVALEGQYDAESGMSDRDIGVELNGLPSETMPSILTARTLLCSCKSMAGNDDRCMANRLSMPRI